MGSLSFRWRKGSSTEGLGSDTVYHKLQIDVVVGEIDQIALIKDGMKFPAQKARSLLLVDF